MAACASAKRSAMELGSIPELADADQGPLIAHRFGQTCNHAAGINVAGIGV